MPAFAVSSGGETAQTQTIQLTVSTTRSSSSVQLELTLSNPSPAVGEELFLYVDMFVPRTTIVLGNTRYSYLPFKSVQLTLPELAQVPQLEWAKPLEKLAEERAIAPGKKGLQVNDLPTEFQMEPELPGYAPDPRGYRRRLSVPLRVRQAGAIRLPAARLAGELFIPLQTIAGTRTTTTNRTTVQAFDVTSQPIALGVYDLAQHHRPTKGLYGGCRPRPSFGDDESGNRANGQPLHPYGSCRWGRSNLRFDSAEPGGGIRNSPSASEFASKKRNPAPTRDASSATRCGRSGKTWRKYLRFT